MKVISIKAHGALDYITVSGFALLPSIFGLTGTPAYLSYFLAVVHLLMTILTNFPLGVLRAIPVGIHKAVEMVVGPTLIASPWILGFATNAAARNVFICAGLIIIAVGLLSDYGSNLPVVEKR
jgi:SPW repeat